MLFRWSHQEECGAEEKYVEVKERAHLEDLGIDGRTILRLILKK